LSTASLPVGEAPRLFGFAPINYGWWIGGESGAEDLQTRMEDGPYERVKESEGTTTDTLDLTLQVASQLI
jgi:hypothetical protein